MASLKKYAGLPDVDTGTEVYETTIPELTEGSTADQSSALRSQSPTASEDGDPNFDRRRINQDAARRRFEPSTIDAQEANFSDTIAGNRRDYKAGHRRRRRKRILDTGAEEYTYPSEESEEEKESLQSRLARLKREAEEVRAEIERLESEKDLDDGEFKDSVEQQLQDGQDLANGMEKLDTVLANLSKSTRKAHTLEQEFLRKLNSSIRPASNLKYGYVEGGGDSTSNTSISAIGQFADRLTVIETVLGVTSTSSAAEQPSSIVPALEILSTQIEVLFSTLASTSVSASSSTSNTTHLDPISDKLRQLITESKRLEDSRKAASKSLEELLETRDRNAHFLQTSTSSRGGSAGSPTSPRDPAPRQQDNQAQEDTARRAKSTNEITSNLFLDEQASKISALYNMLPTIQQLQPLLPTVLERLRALSVIHAGAADTKEEIDELESRLNRWEADLKKWRQGLEGVEKGIEESKIVMKENFETVEEMVKGVEDRVRNVNMT